MIAYNNCEVVIMQVLYHIRLGSAGTLYLFTPFTTIVSY